MQPPLDPSPGSPAPGYPSGSPAATSWPASPSGQPPVGPPPQSGRASAIAATVGTVVGVLLMLAAIAGFVVRVPYVVISPGEATALDDHVVTVDGASTFAHDGRFLYLTVRVTTQDPSLWQIVRGWLDPASDVVKREQIVDCLAPDESGLLNARDMRQSQDDAKQVALTKLGYQVPVESIEVTVIRACPGVPANGLLRVGDRITAVDGTSVARSAEVGNAVRAHRPGDEVRVTVSRDGSSVEVPVVTGRAAPDGTCRKGSGGGSDAIACLGIATQEFGSYQFPVRIDIDTANVGGPSAGLAFTLALIDDLTPGELTGGRSVAVTGAISADGSVLEVGGVKQKAARAHDAGVRLMIVPRAEAAEARRYAGDTRVVGVRTVDDALAALRRAGGSPLSPNGA